MPSAPTIRRTLALVDAAAFDRAVAAWMAIKVADLGGRRVIAIDGKTMRGARRDGGAPHLVAALDHDTGAVLGQLAVAAKSNEIPALRELLDTMDITGAMITADAMHCQRETARHITSAGGHYLLTVKANHRLLRDQLKAIEAPRWVDFPAAAQVLQVRRTRTIKGRKHIEVVYVICSLPMTDAPPATIAAWIQGHWCIENKLHWVRDVIFEQDRHQLRTGRGPQVMATLRNTAISLIRLAGHNGIAASLRHHSRDSRRPIDLLAST